jgi:hypothetical protein
MFAKNEDVAVPRDRDRAGFGRKRPWFVRRRIVAGQYLIDLGRAETRNLDWRLFDDERIAITGLSSSFRPRTANRCPSWNRCFVMKGR